MLRSVSRLIFFFGFLFVFLSSFSQQKLPNTLLWRISGKSLQKPSYLYGTMHLQDKRLFQFGDSLYHALEATDGYAMETNPQEMMDSIFTSSIRKEEDNLLEKQKVSLNRKKLSKEADSLLRSAGIQGTVATKKELKKLRDRRMAKFLQQGEMPTIMDAYLFGLARRLTKWTGGIEDVNDQLALSDELGGKLEPEAVLAPESAMNNSMEQMTKIYLSQNLARIDSFSNGSFNAKDKDEVLIHRNVKMAFRMDSLSHTRPTFFTVGAAHLPGDSGVISLLKSRGFSVEPVFSSATRFAGDYAASLPPAKWDTVSGDDKAYSINMPGAASDYKVFGNLFQMKMCFDMTTMTFYISGAITNGQVTAASLDGMLKGAAENMGGRTGQLKTKVVESGTLTGKEGVVENDEGTYRLRLLLKNKTVYMLMAGAIKKEAINSPDVERFFASFVPGEAPVANKVWETFTLPEKSFSVNMPGKAERAEAIDNNLAKQNWHSLSYSAIDAEKGIYYLVQVREPGQGYVIEGDSAYLAQMKADYKERMGEVLFIRDSSYQSYPALYIDAYVKKEKAVYKVLQVTRGNRAYSLVAGFPKDSSAGDVERFFHSFTLLPYKEPDVKTEVIDGFRTTLPSFFRKTPPDSTEKHSQYQATYICNNVKEAVVYQVFKQAFSPTYWIRNDTALFDGKLDQYKRDNDSVIKKKWVQNGGVKGMEATIQSPGWNGLKRLRFLVNGDTLYTLYSVLPRQDSGSKTHNAFFANFRIDREATPSVYTSKAVILLQALKSGDSAVYADAAGNLSTVEFAQSDLPLLQQALLQPDKNREKYESVSNELTRVVGKFRDSSTVGFVDKNYTSLTGGKAALQYNLLTALARTKTATAYALLKKLLLNHLPASGNASNMRYALFDSMQLTAGLYPELLQRSNDSLVGYTAITLANRLLDSNLLSKNALIKYEEAIVAGARKAEQQLRSSEDESWTFTGWSEMLRQLNSAAGNAVLRKALAAKEPYIKQSVILALLKNNQSVPAEAVAKVAADKSQRGSFYSELKTIRKEGLFPALYASQKSLAESELQNYFSDDYGEFTLTYLTEKTETYNGKKSRFYLYKILMAYNDEEKKQNFLAVAGPYDLAAKEKIATSDASGFYSEEELTTANLNRLFRLYLQKSTAAEK